MTDIRTREKEHQSRQYDDARIERENKRICIVACIILACGSLLMYKNSNGIVWGLILLVSVFVGLYLLSRLAELDDILSEGNHVNDNATKRVVENYNNYSYDKDNIYVKEILDTEETRRKFTVNMPLFKKEAYEKYTNLTKELGMTDNCIGDGVMDVWSTIDGIFGINKWDFFDKEISRFGGKYTNAIIRGDSGRCVDFGELRLSFTELDVLGVSQETLREMIEYNNYLKQQKMEASTREPKKRPRKKKEPMSSIDELSNVLIDVLQSGNSSLVKTSTGSKTQKPKSQTATKTKKETSAKKQPMESHSDIVKIINDLVDKKNS